VKVPSAVKAMYNKTVRQQEAADAAVHLVAAKSVLARVGDLTTSHESSSASTVTELTGAVCDTVLKTAASHAATCPAADTGTVATSDDDDARHSQRQVCHVCVCVCVLSECRHCVGLRVMRDE